jgi:hypothetical protein
VCGFAGASPGFACIDHTACCDCLAKAKSTNLATKTKCAPISESKESKKRSSTQRFVAEPANQQAGKPAKWICAKWICKPSIDGLGAHQIAVLIDFSMNYSHLHLEETSGEHWCHHQTTIVPVVVYAYKKVGN